ncbi:MAG TPA: 50S ribosomal protein L10 [Candidatus Paceibacterota bacterium]|nr:50S ribosomal protein L10 [Candidatus Paceibacterota bacterium]
MLLKSKKEEIIKNLEKTAKENESIVFVNFHGLKVSDETMLRRELRDKGVGYKISRKTLLTRALKGKAEGEMPEIPGEVAIAYSKDQTASAREIYNFQKAHKSPLAILGGIFDGKFVNGVSMMEIATIPSKEVLYAQIANLLNSPIQRFAVVLDQIANSKK